MNQAELIKETGATFTPQKLAEFLARKISFYSSDDENKIVIDPACGDGELLSAMSSFCTGTESQLIGFDTNDEYLNVARDRLKDIYAGNINLEKLDFLFDIVQSNDQLSINFSSTGNTKDYSNYADIIIANPPYVRTQILGSEQAQILAKKFNLKGRVDLYYPFLIAMTKCLRIDGIIGVITSNRYLFTKSGESIRRFLSDNYEILEVIDLGDTKLFKAAVLPSIFIGKKKTTGICNLELEANFQKLYEEHDNSPQINQNLNSVYDILDSNMGGYFRIGGDKIFKKTVGVLRYLSASKESWKMLTKQETKWIKKIEGNSAFRIKTKWKVRVGIKTTADNVFVRNDWDDLPIDIKPEQELLKNLIAQENIGRWGQFHTTNHKILYTHKIVNNKKVAIDLEEFPKARKYLEKYQEVLASREYIQKAGRNWYEIWVSQNPILLKKPKIVFPDISKEPRFYFDNNKKFVHGNCYWIVDDNDSIDNLLLIQAISNSRLVKKYHDLVFNNKLYSSRRRYFSQYVENYPIPNPSSIYAIKIISLAKDLIEMTDDGKDVFNIEEELHDVVFKAFGFDHPQFPD